ncbi:MAG: hypothetical protein ACM3X6_00875 [Patescibacteria group bacterium]
MKTARLAGTSLLLACLLATVACKRQNTVLAPPVEPPVDLVNEVYQASDPTKGDWPYRASVNADLDGDQVEERIVLLCDVESYEGKVCWDDGQVWEVCVDEPSGERTLVYLGYIQFGEMRVARSEDEPGVFLLLQDYNGLLSIYECRYQGPGNVQIKERLKTVEVLRASLQDGK